MATFNNGDRVRVKKSKYREIGPDLIGTVMSVYFSNIAVKIDDFVNNGSQYGYYYFEPRQLEKLRNESNERKQTIMEGNYKVACVRFFDTNNMNASAPTTGKEYLFACYDFNIDVLDTVVVMTAHHGISAGIVTGFVENAGQEITREIICKADFVHYFSRLEARKRRDELKKLMAKQAEKLQEIALYKALAAADPTMADMLKEYTELSNGC